MKLRGITFGLLLAGALAFGTMPAVSFAQSEGEGSAHAGEHESGAAGEHAGEHHDHNPSPINLFEFGHRDPEGRPQPPLLASVINFLLLLGILAFVVRKSINPALADRRAAIEAEIGEAQRLRAEAEALHREYTERLEKMESEFAELRVEFQRAGETEYQCIIEEANRRAERMGQDGQFAIQQEMKQLRDDLMRQAVESASTSAEKAVRAQISPTDQGKLADEYLVNLEKSQGASA